jgi:hypothetical protein
MIDRSDLREMGEASQRQIAGWSHAQNTAGFVRSAGTATECSGEPATAGNL